MRNGGEGFGRFFVGRSSEMAALSEVAAAVALGRGALVIVSGEPGIGKSRLLQEAAHQAREDGLRTFFGRCNEVEGAPPYSPWIQVLRGLLEQTGPEEVSDVLRLRGSALARLLPELRATTDAPAPTRQEEATERRFHLFEAAIALLRASARTAPVLVVLDDLHCADLDSLLLLRQLGGELTDSRIGVLGSLRDRESEPRAQGLLDEISAGGISLPLAGLTAEDVGRWVAFAAGGSAPPELFRALHERTGGNPLFLGEMLRLMRSNAGGGAVSMASLQRVAVPPTVCHVMLERIERLPPFTRDILASASVLGREFEVEPLARLVGAPVAAVLDALDPALAIRLIRHTTDSARRFSFAHVLSCDALYQRLATRERLVLHCRAADALEELAPSGVEGTHAEIARHLLAAAPLADLTRTVDAASAAAHEARRRLALDQAVHYYRQALATLDAAAVESVPDLERRRCELRLALGDALWQVGAALESRRTYLRAAEEARALGDASFLAQAAIGALGRDDAPIDAPPATVALVAEAVRSLCAADDDPLRARLLSTSAYVLSYAVPPRRVEAEADAREAVAIAEKADNAATLLFSRLGLHHALWTPERLAERLVLSEQLVAMAAAGPRRAEIICRHWRAVDLLEAGDVAGARAEIRRHEHLSNELKQPIFQWLQSAFRVMLALLEGRLTEAESLVSEAFALGRTAGSPNALALYGTQLFHLREHQHRLGELETLMDQVTKASPAIRAFEIGSPLIHVDAGQLDKARHAFDRLAAKGFADFPRDGQWLAFLYSAARVCAALHDRPRAAVLLELLGPFEGQCIVAGHGAYWAGSAARCVALLHQTLGDGARASRSFEQAIETHRRADARCLLAHTLREYAELLVSEGRRAAARGLAEEALALYRDIGTVGWASTTEAVLQDLPRGLASPRPIEGCLVCEGSDWLVEFQGVQVRVSDGKGMRDLALLLAAPEREIHVLALASQSVTDGPLQQYELAARSSERRDPLSDERARAAYRERFAELRDELAEAERRHDLGASQVLREEMGWIERELRHSDWLGPDRSSRARKAVYNRVQVAIRRIDAQLPALGRHLRNSIRTGTTCTYHPEGHVVWTIRTPESRGNPSSGGV